ncbi:MAG: phosphoenolpyruvate kinase [Lentisphaerae bacterium]|nr:phosphoenolpyruvate kinase [Lentisphaerota bacterium]
MKTSVPGVDRARIFKSLRQANLAFYQQYPGDGPERQPVHTVYGGANLFKADTARRMGRVALATLDAAAPDFAAFARALDLPGAGALPSRAQDVAALGKRLEALKPARRHSEPRWLPYAVYAKVRQKLAAEPVEDFRIDFEDGYGNRSDAEEDATALAAAHEVAGGMRAGTLPPFIGIRIKPFTEDLKERGARTLDLFITALLAETGGRLPAHFVVMLPKISIPAQVTALVRLFEVLEQQAGLPAGTFKMEMMVETTQAIMNAEGRNPLLGLVRAGGGRMVSAAFGTYDYTASCNITARYQSMVHPVCDFAHHMTRVALGGTGIRLSDGATNVMPVGPHRGDALTRAQVVENRRVVHRAWKLSYDHIRHSLYHGFYQGWDLNPGQLPVRYAAVYAFFLESYDEAATRLRAFVEKAARATMSGDIFDDAATGQGLLNYFLAALNCGAITEAETRATGLTLEEIRSRSFYRILKGRAGA